MLSHLSSVFFMFSKGSGGKCCKDGGVGGFVGREQKNAGATPVFVLKHM